MDLVVEIANTLVWLIRAGAAFRFAYCMFRLIASEEEAGQYRKRARNIVVFYILAESIWQLKTLVLRYYT
jgi:hypothetical protein